MAKHLDSTKITILAAVSLDVESYSPFINFFQKFNFYTDTSILAVVSLDVESYSAVINFFPKCKFYTNISILAAVSTMMSVQRHYQFSDEIDCIKFITISKATKEKRDV